MKHPDQWKKEDLHSHLQHALDLELWTIPLYLTALYSIKGIHKLKQADYPDAAKLILSVVVQEMLHLELVANICNAMGYPPRFKTPVYDESKGIPFIHPKKDYLPHDFKGYSVKPRALGREALKLFCAIELPHPKTQMDAWHEKEYDSIAELYDALKSGIAKFWDECYVQDENNKRQKDNFKEYHNRGGRSHGFSQCVNSKETALKAIEAIIDQGEGADARHVPPDFRPPKPEPGKGYDAGWYKGDLSHYQKFSILFHHPQILPEVYKERPGSDSSQHQNDLNNAFHDFLQEMENNFNSEGAEMSDQFWPKMFGLSEAITAVWRSGACPVFG